MLLSRKPLLIASRRTAAARRVSMHPAQLPPARTAIAMAITLQITAVTDTGMTATSLLTPIGQMVTGITTTKVQTGTAAGTGTGRGRAGQGRAGQGS